MLKKTTTFVMFLLVLMGLVLPLMETVMDSGNLSPSIGGLLKPTNPNEICPKTHYRKPFFYCFNGQKLVVCNVCNSM